MAISWLAVLQGVPWSEVINNAPKVADGARKLWKAVGRQVEATPSAEVGKPQPTPGEVASRLRAMEATLAELHEQLRASSELIKDLAEQNTQLVRRVEISRVRTLWLGVATGGMALVLAGLLAFVLSAHTGA